MAAQAAIHDGARGAQDQETWMAACAAMTGEIMLFQVISIG